jgi:hypothetical protein
MPAIEVMHIYLHILLHMKVLKNLITNFLLILKAKDY